MVPIGTTYLPVACSLRTRGERLGYALSILSLYPRSRDMAHSIDAFEDLATSFEGDIHGGYIPGVQFSLMWRRKGAFGCCCLASIDVKTGSSPRVTSHLPQHVSCKLPDFTSGDIFHDYLSFLGARSCSSCSDLSIAIPFSHPMPLAQC